MPPIRARAPVAFFYNSGTTCAHRPKTGKLSRRLHIADACSRKCISQAQLSEGRPLVHHAANPTEKGLLHLEQWAGLGEWEQSVGRKERGRNSLLTPAGSTYFPDLGSCVLVRVPLLNPEMLRLAGHTGQVAARVKRLGRTPAPSGTLMAQPVIVLAEDLKV